MFISHQVKKRQIWLCPFYRWGIGSTGAEWLSWGIILPGVRFRAQISQRVISFFNKHSPKECRIKNVNLYFSLMWQTKVNAQGWQAAQPLPSIWEAQAAGVFAVFSTWSWGYRLWSFRPRQGQKSRVQSGYFVMSRWGGRCSLAHNALVRASSRGPPAARLGSAVSFWLQEAGMSISGWTSSLVCHRPGIQTLGHRVWF